MADNLKKTSGFGLKEYIPTVLVSSLIVLAFWVGVELSSIRSRLTAMEISLSTATTIGFTRYEMEAWRAVLAAQNPSLRVPLVPRPYVAGQ